MKSILKLFNQDKKKEIINKSEIKYINKSRTSKEINKLLYLLDDELHNLNISEEKKMKLMKNYKVNLDNDNIPTSNIFENQLLNANIPNEHVEQLKYLYQKQLTNRKILENDNTYDSLLFLSELSDKRFNSIKTNMLWRTKTLDFDNCIKHLQETERFNIVRYEEYGEFMNKNKIYFDDEHHKNNPKRDVLYRKINDFYFVANNDYFEKCTDFYFKLYSNVFALFNLKKITLKYHNNFQKMKESNIGASAQMINIENTRTSETKNNSDNEVSLTFDKNDISSTLHMRDFNNCTGEYEETNFIKNLMPENLKKDMYNTSCILNLIKNRTKNTLSSFEQVQNIENTNIENVEYSIKSHFSWVDMPIGLFGSSKTSDYVNKRVVFNMEFHDVLKNIDNIEEKKEEKDEDIQVRNETTKLNGKPRVVIRPDGSTAIIKGDILGWVRMKRDDNIPKLAVEAGYTKNDGRVYIGRIDNSPGKINCKINTQKIWNFLVQGIGTTLSRQSGQIFITNLNYEWIEISKGLEIPVNSIYNGRDENEDQVWIGKSIHNEPGKIMCKKNEKGRPLMDKLWCHGSWCSHRKGYILVVKNCNDIKELYCQELMIANYVSDFEK
tara:strand:- start:31753 stop:33579 length:1827 start_codon:yes stop_codon:yes gene_type:complete